ncbi:hypothetical protein Pfo_027359 [Paulownia fortunei]|nr:hypothetical protein Pfo_027359 [Paulownia fortunei]
MQGQQASPKIEILFLSTTPPDLHRRQRISWSFWWVGRWGVELAVGLGNDCEMLGWWCLKRYKMSLHHCHHLGAFSPLFLCLKCCDMITSVSTLIHSNEEIN